MGLYLFVEGPLLWIAILLFFAGLVVRISFFIASLFCSSTAHQEGPGSFVLLLGRSLVPLHKAAFKKPFYTVLRYTFHLCLFIVPIWLSGHIVLWSESRFEWEWLPLPDAIADGMTLVFLALATYFLMRRLIFGPVRLVSSLLDIVLIIVTALPFLTGYFLTHGTLIAITFFGDNMALIHMISGELMLLTAVCLFYSPRLHEQNCIGCAACVQNCPTQTLDYNDATDLREFNYDHYRCICCGNCVGVCPEAAAELRHELNIRRLFQLFSKRKIRSVALQRCAQCGAYFAPDPQMTKIASAYNHDYINLCPVCRKLDLGDRLRRLSPWHRKAHKEDREAVALPHPSG